MKNKKLWIGVGAVVIIFSFVSLFGTVTNLFRFF